MPPRHMGCTDASLSPYHMGKHTDVQGITGADRCLGGVWKYGKCLSKQRAYGCPLSLKTPHACLLCRNTLFKAKLMHLKIIRESPDHIQNEPTADKPIGGFGQDIKNKMTNTCHM